MFIDSCMACKRTQIGQHLYKTHPNCTEKKLDSGLILGQCWRASVQYPASTTCALVSTLSKMMYVSYNSCVLKFTTTIILYCFSASLVTILLFSYFMYLCIVQSISSFVLLSAVLSKFSHVIAEVQVSVCWSIFVFCTCEFR